MPYSVLKKVYDRYNFIKVVIGGTTPQQWIWQE